MSGCPRRLVPCEVTRIHSAGFEDVFLNPEQPFRKQLLSPGQSVKTVNIYCFFLRESTLGK